MRTLVWVVFFIAGCGNAPAWHGTYFGEANRYPGDKGAISFAIAPSSGDHAYRLDFEISSDRCTGWADPTEDECTDEMLYETITCVEGRLTDCDCGQLSCGSLVQMPPDGGAELYIDVTRFRTDKQYSADVYIVDADGRVEARTDQK